MSDIKINIDNKNLKTELVSSDKFDKGPGYVYNVDGGSPNIPDVNKLLDQILEIIDYMSNDEMLKLRKEDNEKFMDHMEKKYFDFSLRYYAVFMKLLSGEDIMPLFRMLAELDNVKSGKKSLENVEKELGEELANTYIYPKLNKATKNKKK